MIFGSLLLSIALFAVTPGQASAATKSAVKSHVAPVAKFAVTEAPASTAEVATEEPTESVATESSTDNAAAEAKISVTDIAATPVTKGPAAASEPVVLKASGLAKSEQDIPLHLDASAKPAADNANPITKGLMALLILGAFAGGAYFLVNKYKGAALNRNSAPEIKILRQHYLAPKKSLAIIRVAGESILIGITDHNINMIKSLSLLDEDVPEELPPQDFETSLQQATPRTYKTKVQTTSKPDFETDEYSIAGIKDFVNTRLKNMRSIN